MLPDPQPIREWRDVDRARFDDEIAPLGEPAVLRGVVADWPAVQAHDIAEYLGRFDLSAGCDALIAAPGSGGRLFYNDDLTGLNFQTRRPTLATVVERLVRGREEADSPAIAAQGLAIRDVLPGFAAENRMDLLDEAAAPRMWLGNRVIVAAHYDMARNIACVVAGRRRFTLFPPEQVGNLHIGPYEFTPAGAPVSLVDFDAPDLDRFPNFPQAMAAVQSAELAPGDAIYIPYMWWHHVRSLDAFNLLVNYWWGEVAQPEHPLDAMLLGLLAIRDLPDDQRRAWRAMFDQFVFRVHGDPMAHVPTERQGGLGRLDDAAKRGLRQSLAKTLAG